jgi:hypothetical protein
MVAPLAYSSLDYLLDFALVPRLLGNMFWGIDWVTSSARRLTGCLLTPQFEFLCRRNLNQYHAN